VHGAFKLFWPKAEYMILRRIQARDTICIGDACCMGLSQ